MPLKPSASTVEITAQELTSDFVDARFAYETSEGYAFYGRIAAFEERDDAVHLTLAGVIHNGNSVQLVVMPTEVLHVERDQPAR